MDQNSGIMTKDKCINGESTYTIPLIPGVYVLVSNPLPKMA